ncbi:flavodoxin domain-containing protein [Streptomyces muensis]|uniref:Flavodoxin n=1 Tax=Streptomyces muensis TaxID=1077944 RepID=A0A9X1PYI0_STRM4|nr:flavodoxin domain-containing protein [Streptomyces muensis]MCF1595875.1 flavodoxin [Streptomyces muensis]
MTGTVSVTYGTTNGSTARIAETLADVLRKDGLTVEALPAQSVKSVEPYDAVVVGGGLYAGRWQKHARRFLRRHRRALPNAPVAVQQRPPRRLGLRAGHPARAVKKAMAELDAREHVTFGGCLDEGAKGWVARMILRNGMGGDFRDLTAIETWAAQCRRRADPHIDAFRRGGSHARVEYAE